MEYEEEKSEEDDKEEAGEEDGGEVLEDGEPLLPEIGPEFGAERSQRRSSQAQRTGEFTETSEARLRHCGERSRRGRN